MFTVILIVYVAKVAKASLDKALVENGEKRTIALSMLPIVAESPIEIQRTPMIKIDQRG